MLREEPLSPESLVGNLCDGVHERHRVRIWWTDEHVDAVAEAREFAGEEPEIHALTAAAHVSPVRDETDRITSYNVCYTKLLRRGPGGW